MNDTTEYMPPKVWTWVKPSGGAVRQHQPPDRGADARQGTAGRPPPPPALLAGHAERREGHGDARGTAGARSRRRRVRRLADQDRRGRPVRQRLRGGESQLEDPRAHGSQRPEPIRVFESGAILLYLAEKFGAFLPTEAGARASACPGCSGRWEARPILGGGFGHFYAYAPKKIEYAIDRFAMEVKRQLDVLDRRLAETDIWRERVHDRRHGHLALVWRPGEGLALRRGRVPDVHEYKNVQRWTDGSPPVRP